VCTGAVTCIARYQELFVGKCDALRWITNQSIIAYNDIIRVSAAHRPRLYSERRPHRGWRGGWRWLHACMRDAWAGGAKFDRTDRLYEWPLESCFVSIAVIEYSKSDFWQDRIHLVEAMWKSVKTRLMIQLHLPRKYVYKPSAAYSTGNVYIGLSTSASKETAERKYILLSNSCLKTSDNSFYVTRKTITRSRKSNHCMHAATTEVECRRCWGTAMATPLDS